MTTQLRLVLKFRLLSTVVGIYDTDDELDRLEHEHLLFGELNGWFIIVVAFSCGYL